MYCRLLELDTVNITKGNKVGQISNFYPATALPMKPFLKCRDLLKVLIREEEGE